MQIGVDVELWCQVLVLIVEDGFVLGEDSVVGGVEQQVEEVVVYCVVGVVVEVVQVYDV